MCCHGVQYNIFPAYISPLSIPPSLPLPSHSMNYMFKEIPEETSIALRDSVDYLQV